MSCAVEFFQVSKSFTASGLLNNILREVTFAAEAGQITCLLGSSGCGKTTAMRLAAGLDVPEAGRVLIGGKPAGSELIGYIPQQNTLLPWLDIRSNIVEPLKLSGRSDAVVDGEKLAHVLKLSGLEGYEERFPYQCSGGMRQRAMLARQLMLKTELWLLDEPFSSLDEITRSELQKMLVSLSASEGITVLLVTHDINEALLVGERIVVMPSPAVGELMVIENKEKPRSATAEFVALGEKIRRVLKCGAED